MFLSRIGRWIAARRSDVPQTVIIDRHRKLGNHALTQADYPVNLCKEEVARQALAGRSGNFLDLGGGDGSLGYLFDIRQNFEPVEEELARQNRADFERRFVYYLLDLSATGERAINKDVCLAAFKDDLPQFRSFFDVVYSNNVFEHLRRPWVAADNILWMLKPGGICITIAPFAQRYHAVPTDYFRYSHTALPALFEDAGKVRVLTTGYDILGRRNNWQGQGRTEDVVPIDEFGAWRENWFAVTVIQKI